MWFQHRRDSNLRSHSWKKTSQNGAREDHSSKEMEDSNKGQGCRKFPWICEFLLMLYLELQSYSKAIEWTEGQERMEMGWRTSTSIWRTQGQDNKSTSSLSAKERRKIQSRNRHLRTCNRRSTIPRTRWKMETNGISIEDNATSRKKLWNL